MPYFCKTVCWCGAISCGAIPRISVTLQETTIMKTEHLLIIRFSALGEVAMLVPVVSSLARQYPELRITVLSQPFARPLFDGLAANVGFMEADIKGEYHGVKGMNALYRRLVAKNFTAIADLHNVPSSSYLRMRFNLSGYRVEHIDLHRAQRRRLTSAKDRRLVQLPTVFESYMDVLARLDYPVRPDFVSVFPPTGGNLRLVDDGIGQKKPFQQWIGIAPFASHRGKAYPEGMMLDAVAGIVRRHPSCRIFLFGNGEEKMGVMDAWCGRFNNCTNASRLLGSIRQELVLMSHLDVMVSMDSAYMHLASIAGARVVSVWGATHPYAGFLGWGQRDADALQVQMDCRPCSIYGNRPCLRGDYACLSAISPEDVVGRVETALAEASGMAKLK